MTRKMLGVMLGLGMIGTVILVADSACGGGPAIGIGFGGGGGSVHGGVGFGGGYGGGGYHGGGYHGGGYHGGGYHGGSDFGWGVNVPLSSDGSVRLGVGSGGYYPSNQYYRYHGYPYGGYGYDRGYYYQGRSYYSTPSSGDNYEESAPAETPPVPTAGQVGRMSNEQLVDMLIWVGEGYSQELASLSSGDTWVKYFKLAEILDILKKSKSNPLADAARTTLTEVMNRMDSAVKNSEYDVITKSFGFKTLQVGLHEYLLPPAERLGHSLMANLQKLTESLDGVSTGAGWKKHLQIEELRKLAENAKANDVSTGKLLEKILAKFDAVAQNSQYKVIAELDGFAAVQTGLQRYINALRVDQPVPAPPPPAVEE